jgi:hypothetical protein
MDAGTGQELGIATVTLDQPAQRFMSSPEAVPLIRKSGMEPPPR